MRRGPSLRVDAGGPGEHCDGITRRSFVQLGVSGMASFGLPGLLRARKASAESGIPARDTRVILFWLNGGPSHVDLYDLKPQAPPEYRGFWRPIPTHVAGMEISELLPRQAKVAERFSIVRSLRHGDGEHESSAHLMLTGRGGASAANLPGKFPSVGSIAAKVLGPRRKGLPPYVSVPHADCLGMKPGYFGGNYLGRHWDPFETGGDPNRDDFEVRDLTLPEGLTIERLDNRRELRRSLDTLRREVDAGGFLETMNRFEQEAFELVTKSEVRRAFDLSSEDAKLRERYGRNTWGQSALLARRLAEAGVTFVTVDTSGWDHHWNLKERMEKSISKLDAAVAALFEDLASRGLWEKVLVVVCGEMGRTPRMNDGVGRGAPGRDHWGQAMFCLLGGGGVKGGRVVGATDARGERVTQRPVTPQDIHATIYHALGVDPAIQFLNPAGRPVPAVDHGQAIQELF